MKTIVVVNDFPSDRRMSLVLDKSDMDFAQSVWQDGDVLLEKLQAHPMFAGRHRWCDLDPSHYRIFLMKHLDDMATLDTTDEDEAQRHMQSLRFVLSAMVYCLRIRSESDIELMRLHRISEFAVSFDYTAALNLTIYPSKKKKDDDKDEVEDSDEEPKAKLRVVVDNTREDE